MRKCPNCSFETNSPLKYCDKCNSTLIEAEGRTFTQIDLATANELPKKPAQKGEMGKRIFEWPGISILSFIMAGISLFIGFHKMFIYDPASEYHSGVNAYVGGDSYNFIINANYVTAYFVLALILVVFGSTFAMIKAINNR